MNEIFQTLCNKSTYEGSVMHSILNYALIILTLLPHTTVNKTKNKSWLWAFLISVFVQVLLWYLAGAVGVSVIWSSMAGFNLLFFRTFKLYISGKRKLLFIISITAALAAIIFYGILFPFITTTAHITAVLMGIGLFYLYRKDQLKSNV